MKKVAILLLVLTCFMLAVHADTVTMKDGTVLNGKVLMATSSSILFETEDGKQQRIKATEFSAYSVGSKTDLATQPSTQRSDAISTTQQANMKVKTICGAHLEIKERIDNEVDMYNKEVGELTQVQKEKKLLSIIPKILEAKNSSVFNVTDVINVTNVIKQSDYNSKDKLVYSVQGHIKDYEPLIELTVGKIAEKLNKQKRYKFSGLVSYDISLSCSSEVFSVGSDGWELSRIKNIANIYAYRGGPVEVRLMPKVKSCVISIVPADDEVQDIDNKNVADNKVEIDFEVIKKEMTDLHKEYNSEKSSAELVKLDEAMQEKCKSYVGRVVKTSLKISDIIGGEDGWYVLVEKGSDFVGKKYKTTNEKYVEIKKGQVVPVNGLITSFRRENVYVRNINGKNPSDKLVPDVFVLEIRENK